MKGDGRNIKILLCWDAVVEEIVTSGSPPRDA